MHIFWVRSRWLAALTFALSLQPGGYLWAQTCSCGGAPLLGFIGSGPTNRGSWQLAWEYEYNDISNLVAGTRTLTPDDRQQTSQSGLLKISYGVNRFLSVTGMLTMIQKERDVTDLLRVRGVGDGLLLLQANLIPGYSYPQRELVMGIGFKAPIGPADLKRDGLLISADMQPSSGAWDGIFTGYASSEVLMPLPVRVFISTSYRRTGSYQRFSFSNAHHRFGNEFVASFGAGYTVGTRLGLTLMGRYRSSGADRFADAPIPNTGGQWFFLAPGINVALSNGVSLGLGGQLPLYQNLKGAIQLSTKFSLSMSVFYAFGGRSPLGI